jgi:uncharacterized DUF497 family protein
MEFISPMLLQRWKTLALTVRDPFTEDEAVGLLSARMLLAVYWLWFTHGADHARLISARLATPREKSRYEAHYEA